MAVETPFWRSDLMADQSVLRTTGVSPLGSSSKRATIAPMHEMTGFGGFLTIFINHIPWMPAFKAFIEFMARELESWIGWPPAETIIHHPCLYDLHKKVRGIKTATSI